MKLSIDNTLGALFLGISASCMLFGVTLVQTYLYYQKYPKDWVLQKVSVCAVADFNRKYFLIS